MIEPFDVFKLYAALKAHFDPGPYDYIKFHGKSKVSYKAYEARADKFEFVNLGKRYYKKDLLMFFLANMVDAPDMYMVRDMSNDVYIEWSKRTEAVEYYFKNHLDLIFENVKSVQDFKRKFKVIDGQHPEIFMYLLEKGISKETFLVLDAIYPFIDGVSEKLIFADIWNNNIAFLKKYKPFIKYSKRKVKNFLKEKLIDLVDSNGNIF